MQTFIIYLQIELSLAGTMLVIQGIQSIVNISPPVNKNVEGVTLINCQNK